MATGAATAPIESRVMTFLGLTFGLHGERFILSQSGGGVCLVPKISLLSEFENNGQSRSGGCFGA